MSRRLAVLAAALLVAGCAGKKPIVPPDKLWEEGNGAFEDGAYEIAVDNYKALLDQHPFDPNAEEAELRIAQSYYLSHRYPEAIAAFGDFERMHPTSPNLPEVEYHLGLAYVAQMRTTDRDQQPATEAYAHFRNVIDRFPRSPWADRARLRLRECREVLASHEADVAAYYLRHENLRAAEARLRYLLVEYPDTDACARALWAFAKFYAARGEAEGETLALATLVRHHADDPLAREARAELAGDRAALDGGDPLPLLVSHLEEMRGHADRQKLPKTVSAYPDRAGGSPGPRY